MIANLVFLALILTGVVLACVGVAAWVDVSVRAQIREDRTQLERWL